MSAFSFFIKDILNCVSRGTIVWFHVEHCLSKIPACAGMTLGKIELQNKHRAAESSEPVPEGTYSL